MEPESSLPRLKQPATCPCPEPDRCTTYLPPTSRRSILILSFYLRLDLSIGLLPWGFPTKALLHLSSPTYVLHALPFSVSWCYHPNDTVWWGVDYKVPRYVIFSISVLLRPNYQPNLHSYISLSWRHPLISVTDIAAHSTIIVLHFPLPWQHQALTQSVRMEKFGSHSTDFHETWYRHFSKNLLRKLKFH